MLEVASVVPLLLAEASAGTTTPMTAAWPPRKPLPCVGPYTAGMPCVPPSPSPCPCSVPRKNRKFLGTAFRDVKGELFPTLGLHSFQEKSVPLLRWYHRTVLYHLVAQGSTVSLGSTGQYCITW